MFACAVFFAFSDGREWSCRLYEEIEASCTKLLFKEKANVLQLVMHKKIPLNTWPALAVRTPTVTLERNRKPSSSILYKCNVFTEKIFRFIMKINRCEHIFESAICVQVHVLSQL